MPDLVVDTDVLIEVMRNRTDAVDWLRSIGDRTIGISALTRMELVQGAQNRQEHDVITTELEYYNTIHLAPADSQRAVHWFEAYHLSHGVEIIDCLIAASTVRLDLPLYTFNLKHYRVLPELHVQEPYQRND